MKNWFLIIAACHLNIFQAFCQPERWQQHVQYAMQIDMDVAKHQYHGAQNLSYTNNSPDTLKKIFYHLYFNAFQPNSMMDVRSRTIEDADPRVGSRIQTLKAEEQGWIKVQNLSMDGQPLKFETIGTILEVSLLKPILPNSTVDLHMDWDAQVPIQIRRSGRDNREGVAYSMAQWYPKLCEYDYQGWHSNPYIGREFYGVWGDFDVQISIDKNYVVAAGGILTNPQEVGYGYESPGQTVQPPAGDKLRYHFKSTNVHDFVWAADPEFTHTKLQGDDGCTLHFFWQKGKGYDAQWQQLPAIMNKARNIMNAHFGKYPYTDYYYIQGGDGGMEYPMATLITGNRPLNSLVGVAVHEQMHSWYQMVLGTNESLYAWMDEGFTSYGSNLVENELAKMNLLSGASYTDRPFAENYPSYAALATSGKEEPMSTHADHFNTSYAYSLDAYVKGSVFLSQLEYVIGAENLAKGLLRYFDTWKFKHPNPNDFIRVMENQSGLELDWYKEDWVNTLNTIDYGIKSVEADGRKLTEVVVSRIGRMAMPLDIVVTYDNGEQELYYFPLESMRGEKPAEGKIKRILMPDHRWVDPEFSFEIPSSMRKIAKIEIDPSGLMADLDRTNNTWSPQ